jgi:hypothetical protein
MHWDSGRRTTEGGRVVLLGCSLIFFFGPLVYSHLFSFRVCVCERERGKERESFLRLYF